MKVFFATILLLISLTAAFGQNEQAPITESSVNYKDWTYKNVKTDEDVNLRTFTKGHKLVMVVYYAPWCPNWRHDVPMLERLYAKYKDKGLGIIAVGEYDPVSAMKKNLDTLKVSFPAVYESQLRTDKQKTLHYEYRRATGDTRGWGSPWYLFLDVPTLEQKGDTLLKKTSVVNGELIEAEGERFIRKKLGLPLETKAAVAAEVGKTEVCDPAKPSALTLTGQPVIK